MTPEQAEAAQITVDLLNAVDDWEKARFVGGASPSVSEQRVILYQAEQNLRQQILRVRELVKEDF